jgi:hypothetical protein
MIWKGVKWMMLSEREKSRSEQKLMNEKVKFTRSQQTVRSWMNHWTGSNGWKNPWTEKPKSFEKII